MSERDIDELFRKFATLDAELKELRREISQLKPAGLQFGGYLTPSTQPVQWPRESHTDYLKRIGQYNEAQSYNEKFTEKFK